MKHTWRRIAAGLTLATAATLTALTIIDVTNPPADTGWGAPAVQATLDDTGWGTPPTDNTSTGTSTGGTVTPHDTGWG